ncbi:hypothetical protein HYALB_00007943 [Hymenoscyphus albidus]|uniref:Uncharacterized protein n=1 Tax=Hymenoscyphus albidus TaxID=595503 RepID=A0A9N9LQ07_9HELO|nr:hypothetical protein HYALB_00007943 [Hymenoscyphus albidus]
MSPIKPIVATKPKPAQTQKQVKNAISASETRQRKGIALQAYVDYAKEAEKFITESSLQNEELRTLFSDLLPYAKLLPDNVQNRMTLIQNKRLPKVPVPVVIQKVKAGGRGRPPTYIARGNEVNTESVIANEQHIVNNVPKSTTPHEQQAVQPPSQDISPPNTVAPASQYDTLFQSTGFQAANTTNVQQPIQFTTPGHQQMQAIGSQSFKPFQQQGFHMANNTQTQPQNQFNTSGPQQVIQSDFQDTAFFQLNEYDSFQMMHPSHVYSAPPPPPKAQAPVQIPAPQMGPQDYQQAPGFAELNNFNQMHPSNAYTAPPPPPPQAQAQAQVPAPQMEIQDSQQAPALTGSNDLGFGLDNFGLDFPIPGDIDYFSNIAEDMGLYVNLPPMEDCSQVEWDQDAQMELDRILSM